MFAELSHDALAMIEYRDEPSLLVLADTPEGAARAQMLSEEAGYRVQAIAGFQDGLVRLREQARPDMVFVSVADDGGAEFDRLLEEINESTRIADYQTLISASFELVDPIMAKAPCPALLVAGSDRDHVDALEAARTGNRPRLHDAGKDRKAPVRLQQLSEEVGRIADLLASLSEGEAVPEDSREASISSQQVRGIIRARRLRDQYFGPDLFADPAWDMLLDLMAARLEQQRVAVSSLCIAAAVPATTALRWIKALTEQGLFVRSADPQDGRRVYIELSDTAAAALTAYLRAAQRLSPHLI
jgi:CheY-like chemotaxis protein